MPERTSYAPGTFSWADLATTDQSAATEFYSKLFGWAHEDLPVGDGQTYTMFKLNDKDVAACSTQPAEHAQRGVPPMWNSYVTVEDVDLVAKGVEGAGGQVLAPPFDVLDSGRMSVVMDPTGGALCLWQPKEHIGAAVVSETNAMSWNELFTTDVAKAKDFYAQVLGWSYDAQEMPNGTYEVIKNGDEMNGGIMPSPNPNIPSSWTVYFTVDDAAATMTSATDMGASSIMPVDHVPGVGRIGWVQDPQGAVFAIIQPDPPADS